MTLEQLRIFLAVADRLHVTRAADALNLTQSAVSASISALENRHDIKLFDRVGRRIILTEAGDALVPEARRLLARAEAVEMVLEDFAQNTRGRLRLYASQTVANYWLPQRMVTLHRQHPGIELDLRVGNTAQVAQSVEDGDADLGLIEGEVSQGELHRQVVARDSLVLVMARSHPWSARREIPVTDYATQSWVLRESGSGTRSEFEKVLIKAGLTLADLKVSLELPSNEAVLAAVAAGESLSVMSRRAAVASGKATYMVDVPGGERPFAVLTHPKRYRTRAVNAMIEILSAP